jgi:hypothetical protein
VLGVAFSPDGIQLATGSTDGTARIWDIEQGMVHAMLVEFLEGGYAVVTADGYKVERSVGGDLWWAIKLCRFGPGELDGYVPGLRRVGPEEPLPLVGGAGKLAR